MKYLKIHKLVWMILVIIFTLFELLLVLIYCGFYIIYHFKAPKNLWSEYIKCDDFTNHWGGYAINDKTVLETIKRRYYNTFN